MKFLHPKIRIGWVSAVVIGATIGILLASMGCAPKLSKLHKLIVEAPTVGPKGDILYVSSNRDTCKKGLLQIISHANEQGITVDLYPDLENENLFGRHYIDQKLIQIRYGLTSCGQLEVLAHELAHPLVPPGLPGTPYAELFSDAASYIVVKRLGGYDPGKDYANGLKHAKVFAAVIPLYEEDIKLVAEYIITGKWPFKP